MTGPLDNIRGAFLLWDSAVWCYAEEGIDLLGSENAKA